MHVPTRLLNNSAGTVIAVVGLALQFAGLQGWFRSEARGRLLNWVIESKVGLPLEDSAAKEFAAAFPPPPNSTGRTPTHVTKTVIATADGAVINAQLNYMYSDHTRGPPVASMADVEAWAAETPYQWLAWFMTLFGILVMMSSSALDWREHAKQTEQNGSNVSEQQDP